jgi:cell division protein FtsN
LVSGDGLKAYSVVCGSFGVKANAEGLKQRLDGEGYSAMVVYNAERNMYRVVVASYDDRVQAAQARDDFKAKHPENADFQKAWLLYRVF